MKKLLLLLILFLVKMSSFPQGRVVINEYLPWTGNGCETTSEFVELFNFGPGPMDIGCYILTDGDYAITIPPNTILKPGQFYVIAGKDNISKGCANIDSAIHVNLNWNTCNCSSGTIPQTGEGLFTDGGSAGEQIVLLEPNLKVADALVRKFETLEPSSSITTATVGNCAPKTFDLDNLNIKYEEIGESTGRSNSFARVVDGDCGWVKDPQQSANATNNRSGDVASVTYDLTIVNTMDCNNNLGAISINVVASNYSAIFPMNYIVAYDIDGNGEFTLTDQYTYGADSTSPRVDVGNLKAGRYRITLASSLGCNLKTFDFDILPCQTVLPLQVLSFKHKETLQNRLNFEWTISEVESIQTIFLEASTDNNSFTIAAQQTVPNNEQGIQTFATTILASEYRYFRLRIKLKNGATIFSPTINTNTSVSIPITRLWPNPSRDFINLETGTLLPQLISYKIYSLQNTLVDHGTLNIGAYQYSITLPVRHLSKGLYQVFLFTTNHQKPISYRFVKE